MSGWDDLINACRSCRKCALAETRTNIVIDRGSRKAQVMLVGEGPGRQEDMQGIPFVGQAGRLLDLLLKALMLTEEDYYITNIVKCRPPRNRVPTEQEAQICLRYLRRQVKLVSPKIIVCMGSTAARYIIDKNIRITAERGRWVRKKGFWIMPTFHPAALLRDPSKKTPVFEDFRQVRDKVREAGNTNAD